MMNGGMSQDRAAPRGRGRRATLSPDGERFASGGEADQPGPDYSIAVVDRTLDLLEALADSDGPLGVTELARRVGATKSAAYRILANLERRGYVAKDATTTRYAPGTRLAYLGRRSLGAGDLAHVARPVLEDLHARFEETVNLGVLEGDEVVYIDMVESTHGLRMSARVGARDASHSTSLGKAMLAFLPAGEIDRRLERPLAARTANTITDPSRLREELARVRVRGVAEDLAENEVGARCLGAPIFDHRGAVIAAISVSAPASRLDDVRAAALALAVEAAAEEVTRRAGGRSPA